MIYCTFTGLDETVHLSRLCQLSQQFPFIEWGVLYTSGHEGAQGRYPSVAFLQEINALAKQNPHMNFAIHYCGKIAEQLILGEVNNIFPYIKRIQLNIMGKNVRASDIGKLFNKNPHHDFIIQQNDNNQALNGALIHFNNHHVLFDKSGGRGISPKTWPRPLEHKFFGYAGGLGPNNISHEIKTIDSMARKKPYWIDMEQKIRTEDDHFDLSACEYVAQIVDPFYRK